MEVNNLSYQRKGEPLFFKDISFKIEPHEMVQLVGENGAGKSTLLELLPYPLLNQRYDEMLIHDFTLEEHFKLVTIKERITFKRVKSSPLPPYLNEIPTHIPVRLLSGGQRQLAALSLILFKKPRFLLLDEPTANLDKKRADELIDTLIDLKIGCLIVCHNPPIKLANCRQLELIIHKEGYRTIRE